MSNAIDISTIIQKAERAYDASIPGFVHARRTKGPREGWLELAFPDGFVCTSNSSSIETELIYNEVFVNNVYLRSGIEVRDGDTIVDVGANIGVFSMLVLSRIKHPRLHAIEPVPETFAVLQHNLLRYPEPKVWLHNTALGSPSMNEVELVVYPLMRGNSTAHPQIKTLQRQQLSNLYDEAELDLLYSHSSVKAPCTTLSSLMRSEGIETIDLLKIDTEGSEVEVLQGIEQEHWSRIRQASIEVHDEQTTAPVVAEIVRLHGMMPVVEAETRDPFGTVIVTARRDA